MSKTVEVWLDEYGVSHRHRGNKMLHWLCIPAIVFSLLLALRTLPLGSAWLNPATIVLMLAWLYYLRLSWRLALGMLLMFVPLSLFVEWSFVHSAASALAWAAAIFVVAWIGQFVGHWLEGARPSFFQDLQFLLIGPLWLLAAVYRALSLPISDPTQRRALRV